MRTAIVNFSGNVGKSTLARHLLGPRVGGDVISVETINSDEGGTKVGADQFRFIQEYLLESDAAVIDVGASNIEEFLAGMKRYKASHEDIDLFVVPVVPAVKQQEDTIGTIDALASMGVPPSKIRVVFNELEEGKDAKEVFSAIFAYADTEKKCKVSSAAVVYKSELFGDIKRSGKTVSEIVADTTDYRAAMRTAPTEQARNTCRDMLLAKRLAPSVHENLDAVYKVLVF